MAYDEAVGQDPAQPGQDSPAAEHTAPAESTASPAPVEFSVLLPVYAGDRPEFLRRAFDSATVEQTRPPNEVVIVQDGPIGPGLQDELDAIQARTTVPLNIVILPDNVRLARALTAGMAQARYDVIARADADDISLPERFATQLPLIEAGAELVGSALVEFAYDENIIGVTRTMPAEQGEIARYARLADPFNHPTVVFRRGAVERAGGYQHLNLMEDYLLFARMIAAGAITRNAPEALVKYRVGAGAYRRRGGRKLLAAEMALQRTFLREGFTNRIQYVRNVAVRGGYRVVPVSLRQWAYRSLLLSKKLPGLAEQRRTRRRLRRLERRGR